MCEVCNPYPVYIPVCKPYPECILTFHDNIIFCSSLLLLVVLLLEGGTIHTPSSMVSSYSC